MSRRHFMVSTAAASLSTLAIGASPTKPVGSRRPIVVSSANGLRAVEKAMELVKQGHDPLDAAIEGVAIVEADPKDHSVGLGGLPNEDGVVELDAAVMHGPTHGGGSVASIRKSSGSRSSRGMRRCSATGRSKRSRSSGCETPPATAPRSRLPRSRGRAKSRRRGRRSGRRRGRSCRGRCAGSA